MSPSHQNAKGSKKGKTNREDVDSELVANDSLVLAQRQLLLLLLQMGTNRASKKISTKKRSRKQIKRHSVSQAQDNSD